MSSEFPENSCQKRRNLQQKILKKTNQNSSRKSSQLRISIHNFKQKKSITHCVCGKHAAANYIIKRSLKKLWVRIWPMEPNTWAFLVRYMSGKLNTSQHCKSYFMHRKKSPDDWQSIPSLLANNLDSIYFCGFRFRI